MDVAINVGKLYSLFDFLRIVSILISKYENYLACSFMVGTNLVTTLNMV
jgi:hypothetical protein